MIGSSSLKPEEKSRKVVGDTYELSVIGIFNLDHQCALSIDIVSTPVIGNQDHVVHLHISTPAGDRRATSEALSKSQRRHSIGIWLDDVTCYLSGVKCS